jgi:hypothetical protein
MPRLASSSRSERFVRAGGMSVISRFAVMSWLAKNECPLEEAGHGRGFLVWVELDVGQPGVVVDDRVAKSLADPGLGAHPAACALEAVAGDGMTGPGKLRVAAHIHVHGWNDRTDVRRAPGLSDFLCKQGLT